MGSQVERDLVHCPAAKRSFPAEKGEKERAHAENSAIGADRFRIAVNAATGASVAKGGTGSQR